MALKEERKHEDMKSSLGRFGVCFLRGDDVMQMRALCWKLRMLDPILPCPPINRMCSSTFIIHHDRRK